MLAGYTPCTTDEGADFFGDVRMVIRAISSIPVGDSEALLDCDSSVVVRDLKQSGMGWEVICEQLPPQMVGPEQPPMEEEQPPTEPGMKGIKGRSVREGDVVQFRDVAEVTGDSPTGEITWVSPISQSVEFVRDDDGTTNFIGGETAREILEDPKTQLTYSEYSGGPTGRGRSSNRKEIKAGPPVEGQPARSSMRVSAGRHGIDKDDTFYSNRRNSRGIYRIDDMGWHYLEQPDGSRIHVFPGTQVYSDEVVDVSEESSPVKRLKALRRKWLSKDCHGPACTDLLKLDGPHIEVVDLDESVVVSEEHGPVINLDESTIIED